MHKLHISEGKNNQIYKKNLPLYRWYPKIYHQIF